MEVFQTQNSSLSGPGLGLSGPGSSSKKPALKIEDVSLESEAGVDYTQLRDLLSEGKFQGADDETRALLIKLAGPGAVDRKWVYFTEVKFIPEQDLRVIDALWRASSDGKFGYSAQKELWVQNRRYWERLFKVIDWTHGKHNFYRKWPGEFDYTLNAPKGHLPLTNCLRGTQLFKAILEHPAFERPAENESSASPQPDWLNQTETKLSF
ncbi:g2307 [Coccomyxa elongata]